MDWTDYLLILFGLLLLAYWLDRTLGERVRSRRREVENRKRLHRALRRDLSNYDRIQGAR